VDLVAKPGPLAQEGCPARDLATQRERRAVRRPDLREEVGGPERASTSASTLSVFTFADAIASVRIGFETVTLPGCSESSSTSAQVKAVDSTTT
jgi:hypothetical protein